MIKRLSFGHALRPGHQLLNSTNLFSDAHQVKEHFRARHLRFGERLGDQSVVHNDAISEYASCGRYTRTRDTLPLNAARNSDT